MGFPCTKKQAYSDNDILECNRSRPADPEFNYIALIEAEGADAKPKLSQRIMRYFGDERRARALMRIAYRIMVADHEVIEAETKEFQRLCRILGLDPEFVTQASGAGLAQARDLGV